MKTNSKKKKQSAARTKKKPGIVEEIGSDLARELRRVMDGHRAGMQKFAVAQILGEMLASVRDDTIGEQSTKQRAEWTAPLGGVLGGMLIHEWDDTTGDQFSKGQAERLADAILEKLNEHHPEIAGAALLRALVGMPDVWKNSIDEESRDHNRDELLDTILQSGMSYAEQASIYKGLLGFTKERIEKKLKKTA